LQLVDDFVGDGDYLLKHADLLLIADNAHLDVPQEIVD
jgi:hypothetical protein